MQFPLRPVCSVPQSPVPTECDFDPNQRSNVTWDVTGLILPSHPRFHTSETGTIKRLGEPYEVVYRIPQIKKFLRLIEATEDQIDVDHLHEFIQKRVGRIG
jgi:hypothetical protein